MQHNDSYSTCTGRQRSGEGKLAKYFPSSLRSNSNCNSYMLVQNLKVESAGCPMLASSNFEAFFEPGVFHGQSSRLRLRQLGCSCQRAHPCVNLEVAISRFFGRVSGRRAVHEGFVIEGGGRRSHPWWRSVGALELAERGDGDRRGDLLETVVGKSEGKCAAGREGDALTMMAMASKHNSGKSELVGKSGTLEADDSGKIEVVGKSGSLEGDTSGKIEVVGKSGTLQEGNPGKTEVIGKSGTLEGDNSGKIDVVGKSGTLQEGNPGKSEVGVLSRMLKEGNFGNSEVVGKSGTLQEGNPGKSEVVGKIGTLQEGNPGKSEVVGKSGTLQEGNPGKSEVVGKSGMSKEGNPGKSEVVGKSGTLSSAGNSGNVQAAIVIYMAAAGAPETDSVGKYKSGNGLQLPDGAVVVSTGDDDLEGVVADKDGFDMDTYLRDLSTKQVGRLLLYSPLIPSTHTLLSQNFQCLPVGTICVAGAQLKGKGRAGNIWQSPRGCLMFSFTNRMTNGRQVPFLQYVVSLAVIGAVDEVCKARGVPSPDLRIKWPNDLYAKGVKVGGVLCTSSYRAKTFDIVVGVGLNVGNREPTTCLDAIIQDLDEHAAPLQQGELLAAIMVKFESLDSKFQEQGFVPLEPGYYEKWMHSGQRVVLEEKEEGSSEVTHVGVTIQGLTATGYLLASDDEGERYELHPDGNSFDFLKGLVRQKLGH